MKGKYPQPFKTGQTSCIRRLFERSMEARLKIEDYEGNLRIRLEKN
jgi:hypothetical protein